MKKLLVGPRNQTIMPKTTMRLVGSTNERVFRLDRLVVKSRPVDAKLFVVDVRHGKTSIISGSDPIATQKFLPSSARAPHPLSDTKIRRGEEVVVVIHSADGRDADVNVWLEQLEAEDLS